MPKAGRVPTISARALPACLLPTAAAGADAKLIAMCQKAAASFDTIAYPDSGATEREFIMAMAEALGPMFLVSDMPATSSAGIEAKALLLRECMAWSGANCSASFQLKLAASLASDVLRRV